MPANVLMPALSPTMEKGNLAKWLKKEGDKVASGDVLAEIETDKATMEVEAVDEGVLAKILVPEGTADVPVNDLIAVIASEGEDPKAVAASAGKGAAPAPAAEAKPAPEPAKAPEAPKPAPAAAQGGGAVEVPRALHLQVRVDRPLVGAHQQVLAARHDLAQDLAGEVGGGVARHPELGGRQHAPGHRLVEVVAGAPDGVALRHRAAVP